MAKVQVSIENEYMDTFNEEPFSFEMKELIEKVVEAACDFEKCPYDSEVNVLITDEEAVHELNMQYRQIDSTTDVLSFPAIYFDSPADFSIIADEEEEMGNSEYFDPDTGCLMLGDIVINVMRVRSQAKEYGHSEKRELGFLIAHSMLHLFGYDHIDEEERAEMEKRQDAILNNIGLTRDAE